MKQFLFLTWLLICTSYCVSSPPKLLLLSFDGFRYDFITPEQTPNLWDISKGGVRYEKGIQPIFPSYTSPNHNTMLTGLYAESHGIVGNEFYDPNLKEWFDYWNQSKPEVYNNSRSNKFYKATPIWWLNQEQSNDRFSGSMLFPNADVPIQNKAISENYAMVHATGYTYDNMSFAYDQWRTTFDILVQWFKKPENPINFGMFYIGQPDEIMHLTGISKSHNFSRVIHEVDEMARYIRDRLKAEGLYDDMNIIWTADHGHAQYRYPQDTTPINHYLGLEKPEDDIFWSGVSMMPKRDGVNMSKVYDTLRAAVDGRQVMLPLKVWWKQKFPEKYHFKNSDRVGDIIVVPEIGTSFNTHAHNFHELNELWPSGYYSTHGYMPEELKMHAYLVLTGPSFIGGRVESATPEMVDLFALMAHVLQISHVPNNNGSISRFGTIFASDFSIPAVVNMLPSLESRNVIVFATMVLPLAMLMIFIIVCCVASSKETELSSVSSSQSRSGGYMKLRDQSQQRQNQPSSSNGSLLLDRARVDSMSEDEI